MFWIFLSVISNTIATILLKIDTLASTPPAFSGSFSVKGLIPVLLAYALALFSYRQALIDFQVSVAYAIITSLTTLLVGLTGIVVFGEFLSVGKIIGFIFVSVGVFLFTSPLVR